MSRNSLAQIEEDQYQEHWSENENMQAERSFTERHAEEESPFIERHIEGEDPFMERHIQAEDPFIGQHVPNNNAEEEVQILHELELLRRKKALLKYEVQLTRRELTFERKKRDIAMCEGNQFSARLSARVTLDMIAKLLDYFKGNSEDVPCWSKQLLTLQSIYGLSDDETKILMAMRMQGRAKKWLQWNPEIIEMGTTETLEKLKTMFCHQSSKIMIRKRFEERTWKKNESFDDYFYDKIIMANRVPIHDKRELVDNIIDGIPDEILRNQAKMHCFQTPEALLQAFEQLSLLFYEKRNQSKRHKDDRQTGISEYEKNRKKKDRHSK